MSWLKEKDINSSLAELLLIFDSKLCKHASCWYLKGCDQSGCDEVGAESSAELTQLWLILMFSPCPRPHDFLTPRSLLSVLLWQGFKWCNQTFNHSCSLVAGCNNAISLFSLLFYTESMHKLCISSLRTTAKLTQLLQVTPLLHFHLQIYDQICNKQVSEKQIHSLCSCFEGNFEQKRAENTCTRL